MTNELHFPFNVHFTFLFSGFLAAVTAGFAFLWFTPLNDKPLPTTSSKEQTVPAEGDAQVDPTPAEVELTPAEEVRKP